MAGWIDRLLLDGERLDARVEANLAGGELLRTMDGASSLTLQIHDPDRRLLESGVLTRRRSRGDTFGDAAWTRLGKVQASLDGSFFRLAGLQKTGSLLSLTFEDEIVVLLRRHTRLIRAGRAGVTRAQFVNRLLLTVKDPKILSHIPALTRKQPIKDPDIATTKVGQQGIPAGAHLEIKRNQADREQIRNLNTILDEAAKQNATERVTIAMLCAAIIESSVRAVANFQGSGYAGVFQALPANIPMRDTQQQAHYFLSGGKGFQAGGAIKAAAQHPTWSPGRIALAVEGSVSNFASVETGVKVYETYKDEAEKILDAYGGTGKIIRTRERYVYRAGSHGDEHEDYWEAILRLAGEVNWRAFTTNNVFFYAADDDLMSAQPAMTVAEQPTAADERRGVQYVGDIDFDWDYGKPASELTFSTPAERWLAYPGSVSEVIAAGKDPRTGRWLNWQFRQPLDSSEMEITLRRPSPALDEPAATIRTATVSTDDAVGADLLRWARTQLGTQEGSAKQIRYAAALGFSPSLQWCSIFLAYGLKHVAPSISLPDQPAYSGAWLHWPGASPVKLEELQPGDLVIFDWGDGGKTDHVAIFAGHSSVIGGNQGNRVSSVPLNRSALVGAVRIRNP